MAKTKKKTDYAKFLAGIAAVMAEHNVDHVLVVSTVNAQIRNTYLNTGGEDKLYAFLSDGINGWLKQGENN